ncbi:hypothetical protein SAMN05444407_10356 [Chryseobacterium contaminans]|uniref:Uncharacterized protein n=1 Tax=Chryseobacterium contaminans TaxID=1423959 RepID=A0A1M6Z2J9_9FLAO|nr:hypothetical protein SAMN05444407_10356 [Chryseobacterium contaminans]
MGYCFKIPEILFKSSTKYFDISSVMVQDRNRQLKIYYSNTVFLFVF